MKNLRNTLIIGLLAIFSFTFLSPVNGQSVKGKTISYFQAPADGVKFKTANVFLSYDEALATTKKEAKQEKNSAMGSKFGALGTAVANTANSALDMLDSYKKVMATLQDDQGRFATWDFIPKYIIANTDNEKAVNVEIFILNEENSDPMGPKAPTTADKNGFYDVPYYVNVRYVITDELGSVIYKENLGALSGTMKTKDYTPPTPTTPGASLSQAANEIASTSTDDLELPIEHKLGVNAAYRTVRSAVFARFGFSTLTTDMKLGVVKEAKGTKKMIKPTLEIFENKESFLLSDEEKNSVRAFAEEIEKNLGATKEKTKWVALHNLALCYAWLEDGEKATKYYNQYADEIRTTIDKMECWTKVMNKEMTSKEMKAKCGSTFIGMKDQKKFSLYNDIANFVKFYPAGANRYETLFYTINRDLARFTDFYAVNDLLCQLFEIDFPYQFLPLNDMKGEPKDLKATITKEGMEPIEYRVKYDRKGNIKNFEADQVSKLEDGSKEKLITRDLKPVYDDETGKYLYLETGGMYGQSQMVARKVRVDSWEFSGYKYYYDPVASMTKANLNDITKKAGGIFADKSSNENIQMKVDLDGKMYFTGTSSYFKANAFFKEMLNAYGIVPKQVNTDTKFITEATINENGVMTNWTWDGSVKTDLRGAMESRKQNLTAEKMVRGINYTEVDAHGNPIKAEYTYEMKGSMNIAQKVSVKEFFQTWGAAGDVSNEAFDVKNNGVWDCSFEYDAAGNWTKMQIGPYTAEREIKY